MRSQQIETKALKVILSGWRQNKGTNKEHPRAKEANSETQGGARKKRSGENEKQSRAEGVERLICTTKVCLYTKTFFKLGPESGTS